MESSIGKSKLDLLGCQFNDNEMGRNLQEKVHPKPPRLGSVAPTRTKLLSKRRSPWTPAKACAIQVKLRHVPQRWNFSRLMPGEPWVWNAAAHVFHGETPPPGLTSGFGNEGRPTLSRHALASPGKAGRTGSRGRFAGIETPPYKPD